MRIEKIKPVDIEKRSFEIIDKELSDRKIELPLEYSGIIKRCIHTSADFDYANSLYFSEGVVNAISTALRSGCYIVTDTNMVKAGINKSRLDNWGTDVVCYIGDPDIREEADTRGLTRSYVSMERAVQLDKPVIFAVGNAPTALFSILELNKKSGYYPIAVVGVPVGFVNVEASKEAMIESGIPCIVNRGRKGGSNIAACIINAIQYNI